MEKIKNILIIVFLLLAVTSCKKGKATQEKKNNFVKVSDTQFTLNGKPYYFMGTNLWYGAYLGSTAKFSNRERLIKELDMLDSLGVKNLRILAASEGPDKSEYRVRPSFQSEPGVYNQDLLVGLDYLLSEMKKRGMHAVVFLNNYWVWSGGMSQYVSWMENEEVPNPFLEQYDWGQFMRFSARFYSHEEANKYFKQYIETLLNRKNKFTGEIYKNDPTIMAWELANEPRPGREKWGKENMDNFNIWIDETAAYIRSLDSNHLITTGNEGTGGCIDSLGCYLEAHDGENIDYMTAHIWVLNWSWFDPKRPETYPEAERKAVDYLLKHIEYAEKLGKPITFEEFGIPRDYHSYSPSSSTTARDKYFSRIFEVIYNEASNGTPAAGSNFWTWAGEGRPDPDTANPIWEEGDDFTGDPPQEPQGRNSVFSSDASTLTVIKKYAEKMNFLCK